MRGKWKNLWERAEKSQLHSLNKSIRSTTAFPQLCHNCAGNFFQLKRTKEWRVSNSNYLLIIFFRTWIKENFSSNRSKHTLFCLKNFLPQPFSVCRSAQLSMFVVSSTGFFVICMLSLLADEMMTHWINTFCCWMEKKCVVSCR